MKKPHNHTPASRLTRDPADGPTAFVAAAGLVLLCLTPAVCFGQQVSPGQNVSIASRPAVRESWFVIEFEDQPVGYEVCSVERLRRKENGDQIRRSQRSHMKLRRLSREIHIEARLTTFESESGVLTSWDLERSTDSGATLHITGELDDSGQAYDVVEVSAVGERRTVLAVPGGMTPHSAIPSAWFRNVGRSGIARKDREIVDVLFPENRQFVDMAIVRLGTDEIASSNGSNIAVVRFKVAPVLQPDQVQLILLNEQGEIEQIDRQLLGSTLRLKRSSADEAIASATRDALDITHATSVGPDRPFSVTTADRVVLRLSRISNGGNLIVPSGSFQTVTKNDDGSLTIELMRAGIPRHDPGGEQGDQKSALEESRWLKHSDARVQRIANSAFAGAGSPDRIARQLTREVFSRMSPSALSIQMQPADVVAEKLVGDCTEYSVLLAAALRAREIPARIATGLAYAEDINRFVAHMWVEAYIYGVWIPLDATIPGDSTSPRYIKLADSELPDSLQSSAVLFVPLLNLAGQLKIEVIEPDAGVPGKSATDSR